MSEPTISQRILTARLAARLTQQELADAVGVHVTQISKWEKGTTPKVESLRAIAAALGCKCLVCGN